MASRFKSQLLIFAIAMGVFASVTSTSMLTIAFPDLAREFGISFSILQWRNILFFTLFACGLPFFGKISDRFGTRRQFLLGLGLFCISALLSAFMKQWSGFLVCQCLQAISDAMIVSVQSTLIRASFPENRIGWAFGWFSAVLSISALIGPPLSGFILSHGHWSLIFYFLFAIAVAALLLACFIIPAPAQTRTQSKIPFLSTSCLLIMILSIQVLFSDLVPAYLKVYDTVLLIASCLLLLFSEKRRNGIAAIFPAGVLKNSIFLTASIRAFLIYTLINANALYTPSFLRGVLLLPAQTVGLILLIPPLLGLLAAGSTGHLADKGPRQTLSVGILLMIIGMYLYTRTDTNSPMELYVMLSVLLGLGTRLILPAQNRIAMLAVPTEQTGHYMGIFNMLQFASGAFAGGLFGPIVQGRQADQITASGFHTLVWICILMQGAALLTVFTDQRVLRKSKTLARTSL